MVPEKPIYRGHCPRRVGLGQFEGLGESLAKKGGGGVFEKGKGGGSIPQ